MRRLVVLLSLCSGAACALCLAAACDESGTVLLAADSAPPDVTTIDSASGDAGALDARRDAVEELAMSDVCGQPPWVTLGITVVSLDIANPDGSPLPGASFTSPLCPGTVKTSDDAGYLEGLVSKDVPFYGRLQAPGYISELAPEEIFDADSTGNRVEMLPSILGGLVGYDGGGSPIVVLAQKLAGDGGDAGVCATLDGITFSVPGHPEARVVYFSSGAIPAPLPDAGATSTRGLAAIFDLAPGGFVSLAGAKPGCSVLFQHAQYTGRVALETGFVSLMPAYLTP